MPEYALFASPTTPNVDHGVTWSERASESYELPWLYWSVEPLRGSVVSVLKEDAVLAVTAPRVRAGDSGSAVS